MKDSFGVFLSVLDRLGGLNSSDNPLGLPIPVATPEIVTIVRVLATAEGPISPVSLLAASHLGWDEFVTSFAALRRSSLVLLSTGRAGEQVELAPTLRRAIELARSAQGVG